MATLFDKLFNRKIKGKLTIEDTDELSSVLKKAVEQADSSDIYELPAEPTQAQLEEAVKHKLIKNSSGYIFASFLLDDSDAPNLHHYYGCVYGADDGIANAGFDILDIYYLAEGETHYSSQMYEYAFSQLLNFGSSEAGKVLVLDSNGQAEPQDFGGDVVDLATSVVLGTNIYSAYNIVGRQLCLVTNIALPNGTTISNGTKLLEYEVPESWYDKIVGNNLGILVVRDPDSNKYNQINCNYDQSTHKIQIMLYPDGGTTYQLSGSWNVRASFNIIL